MIKISIVIPMFNSFHTLRAGLMRFRCDTACALELIVVDDCSNDSSYTDAVAFASESDLDVKVLRVDSNRGPGHARNVGVKEATGDYITFMDSDDYFRSDFSEKLLPLLDGRYDCVIFDYASVSCEGEILTTASSLGMEGAKEGPVDSRVAFVYAHGSPWGKIYKRETIVQSGIRFAELYRNEDMPFTKAAIALSTAVYYCKDDLYRYVQRQGSLMSDESVDDESNCQRAFALLSETLRGRDLTMEMLAIELRCVLNNTVLHRIAKRSPRREIVRYIKSSYRPEHLNNRYFKDYPRYARIISLLAYRRCISGLRLIWWYARRKKERPYVAKKHADN